jgi:arsenate reductase-like glutaredoxin family protein
MKITATVYTGPNCRACGAAIAWLKQQGVEAVERSYEEAPFQVWSLPVIVLGDEIVTGFDKAKLSEVLRRVKK